MKVSYLLLVFLLSPLSSAYAGSSTLVLGSKDEPKIPVSVDGSPFINYPYFCKFRQYHPDYYSENNQTYPEWKTLNLTVSTNPTKGLIWHDWVDGLFGEVDFDLGVASGILSKKEKLHLRIFGSLTNHSWYDLGAESIEMRYTDFDPENRVFRIFDLHCESGHVKSENRPWRNR